MPEDIEACVRALKGKKGIDNPYSLCYWMKGQGKELPSHKMPMDDTVALKYQAEMLNEERGEDRKVEKLSEQSAEVQGSAHTTQTAASAPIRITWQASIVKVEEKKE